MSEKLKLNDAPCDCYEELDKGFICERCYCGNNGDLADMVVFCDRYNKQVSNKGNSKMSGNITSAYDEELKLWSSKWRHEYDQVKCIHCDASQHYSHADDAFEHKKDCGARCTVAYPWQSLYLSISNVLGYF